VLTSEVIKELLDVLDLLQKMEPDLDVLLAHQKVLAVVDDEIASVYADFPFEEN